MHTIKPKLDTQNSTPAVATARLRENLKKACFGAAIGAALLVSGGSFHNDPLGFLLKLSYFGERVCRIYDHLTSDQQGKTGNRDE